MKRRKNQNIVKKIKCTIEAYTSTTCRVIRSITGVPM